MTEQEKNLRIANGTMGTCPICGKVLRVKEPAGGDGTARIMLQHKYKGQLCEGRFRFAKEWE